MTNEEHIVLLETTLENLTRALAEDSAAGALSISNGGETTSFETREDAMRYKNRIQNELSRLRGMPLLVMGNLYG